MQSFAKTHVQFARHKARAWREPRQTPSGERRVRRGVAGSWLACFWFIFWCRHDLKRETNKLQLAASVKNAFMTVMVLMDWFWFSCVPPFQGVLVNVRGFPCCGALICHTEDVCCEHFILQVSDF